MHWIPTTIKQNYNVRINFRYNQLCGHSDYRNVIQIPYCIVLICQTLILAFLQNFDTMKIWCYMYKVRMVIFEGYI